MHFQNVFVKREKESEKKLHAFMTIMLWNKWQGFNEGLGFISKYKDAVSFKRKIILKHDYTIFATIIRVILVNVDKIIMFFHFWIFFFKMFRRLGWLKY
jgi:hypothetical protein